MRIQNMYVLIHILWHSSYAYSMATIIIPQDTHEPIEIPKQAARQASVLHHRQLRGPISLAWDCKKCRRVIDLLTYTAAARLQANPYYDLESILSKKSVLALQECIMSADYLDCPFLLEAALHTFIKKITVSPHTLWQWYEIMDQSLDAFTPPIVYMIDTLLRKNIIYQLGILNTEKIRKYARQYISSNPITCIGLSHNNKIFVSGSIHGHVSFRSTHRRKLLGGSLDIHTEPITSFHFCSESSMTASISAADKKIQLWMRDIVMQFIPVGNPFIGETCDLSPDGSLIAIPQDNHMVHLYNTESHELIYSLHGHTDSVKLVCFNYNGNMLASYADDNMICIWDIQNNLCIAHIPSTSLPVVKLYFDKKEPTLISQHNNGTINTWDTQTGTLLKCNNKQQPKAYKHTADHPTDVFSDIYRYSTLPISKPITGAIQTSPHVQYCISADQTRVAVSLLNNHMVILWNLFDTATLDKFNDIKAHSQTDQLLLLSTLARFAHKTKRIDLRTYAELRRQYNELPIATRQLLEKCIKIKH